MSGNVSIQGQLTGLPTGNKVIGPITITPNSSSEYEELAITLATGFNTISVPSWAAGVVIIPNGSNAVTMTLKGVTGDTGIPLSRTQPTLLTFLASPPSSFGLTVPGSLATVTTFIFF